jgi:glycosyltransferase A (GT-A) superfamily protein (DUF2064 family)/SAM-dependent methyltransferase
VEAGDPVSSLIVIAKEPAAGRVKTRLCPPFTAAQAASLARASLLDTLEAVRRAPTDHRVLVLDGEAGDWLPPRSRDGFVIVPQLPGTLDVRLAAAFAAVARIDRGPALLVGMDTPQATAELLSRGLTPLVAGDTDAAFGPAADGGFWTLGLREPGHRRVRGLLVGVPMSRADTGRIQHERLVDAGLRISILPTLRDIDDAADARAVAALIPHSRFARLLHRTAPGDDEPLPETAATQTWSGPVSSGYERALWQTLADARDDTGRSVRAAEPITLTSDGGVVFHLDVAKYTAAPDATDIALLDRCTGPTLDIGCGPGRLAAELARRGVPSLGVDVTPVALLIARAAGATALHRSVFDRLPGEGRWPHALLIDGNIGIGGDPAALLARIRDLLLPRGGQLLVETAADERDERHALRLGERGAAVRGASVAATALRTLAEPLGYREATTWTSAGRSFTTLVT